jgi:hypothetical protein
LLTTLHSETLLNSTKGAALNSIDLLISDVAELPRDKDPKVDFQADLTKAHGDYIQELQAITSGDPVSQKILGSKQKVISLGTKVRKAITYSLEGKPDLAISELESGLALVKSELNVLTSQPLDAGYLKMLFRARLIRKQSRPKSHQEMFHIPFELRHLVGQQRYSFPGLPCLYLGGSSYLCWEELGRPPLANMYVSRMELANGQTLRLLNLGYRPAYMAALLSEYGNLPVSPKAADLAHAHAVLWPLVAACSYRVVPPQKPFKIEYVVPQLLLRLVIDSPIYDGIRYFSTHITNYNTFSYGMNFVIPVRTHGQAGLCQRLSTKLLVTDAVRHAEIFRKFKPAVSNTNPPDFPIQRLGKTIPYSKGPFYRLDAYLLEKQKAHKV